MPQLLASEFVKLQLLTDSLTVAGSFIHQNSKLSPENKAVFQSYNLLLSRAIQRSKPFCRRVCNHISCLSIRCFKFIRKSRKDKIEKPFYCCRIFRYCSRHGEILYKELERWFIFNIICCR